MKNYKINERSFSDTLERLSKNSVTFENSSESEDYTNDMQSLLSTSRLGLKLIDNVLIDRHCTYLKNDSSLVNFDNNEARKYHMRPKVLSLDYYGYIDFWYIILAVNDFQSVIDFKDFKSILLPRMRAINKTCLIEEI